MNAKLRLTPSNVFRHRSEQNITVGLEMFKTLDNSSEKQTKTIFDVLI